ncbi:MAG: hypothetical protein JHC21_01920 [Thermocrinis sp.]|nr:hypothetical protein [Thermocrinis sp.]
MSYKVVDIKTLLSVNPKQLSKYKPATIIPDGVLQHIHPNAVESGLRIIYYAAVVC